MKDPNLYLLASGALLIFTAIALYAESATAYLSRKTRRAPPPRALLTVTRLWFALLSLGCLALMLAPYFHRR